MRGHRFVVGVVATVVGVLGLLPASASAAEVDTTPPVLSSAAFSAPTLTAPGTITLALDASDDVGIVRADVRFFERGSHRYTSVTDTTSPLTIERSFSSQDANGTWQPYDVRLTDAAGNYANYTFDGGYYSRPSSTTRTHDVDLDAAAFVLSGASDRTPPTLTSVQRVSAAGRAGEQSTWSWSVTDAEHLPATITASVTNPATGHTVSTPALPASPGSGTWSLTVPHAGEWRLTSVDVTDSVGNRAVYELGGRMSISNGFFPGRHDLPFSSLGLGVAPAGFTATVVERARRLTLVLPDSVSPANLTGVRVTASPSGAVVQQPLGRGASMLVELPDLPMGVTQKLSVTLTSTWGDSPTTTLSGRPVLSRNVTGTLDVTGDRKPDVFATQQSGVGQDDLVLAYPGSGRGRVSSGSGWFRPDGTSCGSIASVDVPAFGRGELLCRTDALDAVREDQSATRLGTRGWGTFRWVDGGFSLNADAYPDVIAMDPTGELRLYAQTSKGTLVAWPRIGTGWQSMISVVSAGDLTGDRKNDIAAVDAAGRLWLYPGNGNGGVTARRQIGSGWQDMDALMAMRDFDGDRKADLGGITRYGELRLYPGTGTGGVRVGPTLGVGWEMFL